MNRPILNPKAISLIALVLATVLYDTFTPGFQILPLPLLSFLQGFILVAAPATIWWIVARKIQVNRDRNGSGNESSYGSAVSR